MTCSEQMRHESKKEGGASKEETTLTLTQLRNKNGAGGTLLVCSDGDPQTMFGDDAKGGRSISSKTNFSDDGEGMSSPVVEPLGTASIGREISVLVSRKTKSSEEEDMSEDEEATKGAAIVTQSSGIENGGKSKEKFTMRCTDDAPQSMAAGDGNERHSFSSIIDYMADCAPAHIPRDISSTDEECDELVQSAKRNSPSPVDNIMSPLGHMGQALNGAAGSISDGETGEILSCTIGESEDSRSECKHNSKTVPGDDAKGARSISSGAIYSDDSDDVSSLGISSPSQQFQGSSKVVSRKSKSSKDEDNKLEDEGAVNKAAVATSSDSGVLIHKEEFGMQFTDGASPKSSSYDNEFHPYSTVIDSASSTDKDSTVIDSASSTDEEYDELVQFVNRKAPLSGENHMAHSVPMGQGSASEEQNSETLSWATGKSKDGSVSLCKGGNDGNISLSSSSTRSFDPFEISDLSTCMATTQRALKRSTLSDSEFEEFIKRKLSSRGSSSLSYSKRMRQESLEEGTGNDADYSSSDLSLIGAREANNEDAAERFKRGGDGEQILTAEVRRSSRVLEQEEMILVNHSGSDSEDDENLADAVEASWRAGEEARRHHYSRRSSNFSSDDEALRAMRSIRAMARSSNFRSDDEAPRLMRSIRAIAVDDEPVEAIPMSTEDAESQSKDVRKHVTPILICVLIAIVIGLSVGLAKQQKNRVDFEARETDKSSQPPVFKPTLLQVKKEGILRCGVPDNKVGFSSIDAATGEREGMSVDLCKAIAAAVLGPGYRVEFVEVQPPNRFTALAGRDIDVLMYGDTHTMERDFSEKTTGTGFQFSDPYVFDGLGFAGIPRAVECADAYEWVGDCSDLSICVSASSTHEDILSPLFPRTRLIRKKTYDEFRHGLVDGECLVVAGEQSDVAEIAMRDAGYAGEYSYGTRVLSKEPLALVTRKDDQAWSDVVNWILRALIHAEKLGVTQSKASQIKLTQNKTSVAALEEVGNYGEIWARHLEKVVPRKGLNLFYAPHEDTGLLYSHPFGVIDNGLHHEFDPLGRIFEIIARGRVNVACSAS
ncbi:hypothetical protein ACHAWF_011788 [Thalassiosira exigua]